MELLQALRNLWINLKRRLHHIETSPYVLFGLFLSLVSTFGEHIGWRCPSKTQHISHNLDYHYHSNWSTHLLANQGAIIQPIEIPFFAEFSFALDFEFLEQVDGSRTIRFVSPWKPNEDHQLTKLSPDVYEPKVDWPADGNRLKTWIQDGIRKYVYGKLNNQLHKRNLQIAIPPEHFALYAQIKVEFLKNDKNQTGVFNSPRMRLRIPVRRTSTHSIQIVRIKFIDFRWEQNPDYVCSGKWWAWMTLSGLGTEPLAMVRDQEVHLIYPRVLYGDDSHYMICDSFVCEITESAKENFAVRHPCLSAIQRDATVKEVEDLCQIICKQTKKSRQEKPDVIELRDKLFISSIHYPISVKCQNSSQNHILEVPPSGALEMRIRCGCELFYNSELLWSRRPPYQGPSYCISTDSLDLDVFQLQPSSRFIFKDGHEILNHIPLSDLETKVFNNISGFLVAREIVEKLLEQKLAEVEDLGIILESLALALAVLILWGLYRIFYKICIPPWYVFLDWLEELAMGLQIYIIERMDTHYRNYAAVMPDTQPILTAGAA